MAAPRIAQLPGTPVAPETVLHMALETLDIDGVVAVIRLDSEGRATIETSDMSDQELAFCAAAFDNFVRETIFPRADENGNDT